LFRDLCDPLVMKDLLVDYFTDFSLVAMSVLPILPPLQLADCYQIIHNNIIQASKRHVKIHTITIRHVLPIPTSVAVGNDVYLSLL
jgi:hypothetical protein